MRRPRLAHEARKFNFAENAPDVQSEPKSPKEGFFALFGMTVKGGVILNEVKDLI
jgi:hypothetical protein